VTIDPCALPMEKNLLSSFPIFQLNLYYFPYKPLN